MSVGEAIGSAVIAARHRRGYRREAILRDVFKRYKRLSFGDARWAAWATNWRSCAMIVGSRACQSRAIERARYGNDYSGIIAADRKRRRSNEACYHAASAFFPNNAGVAPRLLLKQSIILRRRFFEKRSSFAPT